MIKRFLLGIGLVGICSLAQAQQTFSLPELLQRAEQNYPALMQKKYILETGSETEKILNTSLIPALSVTGQSTYQSEVTKFGSPSSGFPILPYDNYTIGLDLHFSLTEFAVVKTKKQLEDARMEVSLNQLDVELQRLKERVTSLFGNILLLKESQKILLIKKQELTAQKKKISVAVNNGYVLKSNQLVFESEILTTEQKMVEIDAAILSLTQELSLLTGQSINSESIIQALSEVRLQKSINRAELQLFNSQLDVYDIQKKVLRRENLPKLSLFSQGNYGRPGYNFLNINLRPYGIVGASLNWNLNNIIIQKNRINQYDINKKMVETQKETFNMNLHISLDQKETEVKKFQTILSKDEEIVSKRKEILKAFASQLENGAITSTEYLTELNAANSAELNQVLHKVQMVIAQTQYNLLAGN